MATLKIKLWKVYLPFLLLLASTMLLYNTGRWLLDIKLNVLPIKSELLQHRQQFYAKARDDFAAFDFTSVSYFERLRPSNDLSEIQDTISQHTGLSEKPVVLQIRSNAFTYRVGHDYFSTVYAVAIACLAVLLMVSLAKLAPPAAWPVKRQARIPKQQQNSAATGANKGWRRKRNGRKGRK